MVNSGWPFLTKSPSWKETSCSCPVTCERTEIVVYASTFPMAARSTGTSRSVTFVVTTGTAPPSPRPRPPRPPPPPPVPAAEPEQPAPVIEANRTKPETRMNARLDKVLNSRVRAKKTTKTAMVLRAGEGIHLRTRNPPASRSIRAHQPPDTLDDSSTIPQQFRPQTPD